MIHTSYRHGKGTDLTRLAPDPNTFVLPAERTFLRHPLARGTARDPTGETAAGVRKRGQAAHAALRTPSSISTQQSGQAFLGKEQLFLCFEI